MSELILKGQKAKEAAGIVGNLSTGEKKMLLNAKQILVSELVLAESKEKDEIEHLVEAKINTSYELHGVGSVEELQRAVGMAEEPADNIVKKFIPAN